jgi:signal transduction histidine kinase
MISYFITINYHTLIRQNDISAKRLEFLQQRNINTFILGQEETRENITESIQSSILNDIKHSEAKTKTLATTENAAKIDSILQDFTSTINDLNNITSNYVAPDMQNINFRTLVQTAMDKLYLEKEVHFDFGDVYKNFTMNAHANTHLYRVLQEVSNNIIKHAQAEKIEVTTAIRNRNLFISVKDDGVGISADNKTSKGIGLINIESRIRSLNGIFKLDSHENKGTTYSFELPVKDIA